MRDSAALRFSTWTARLLIVEPSRFCTAPSEPRRLLTVLIAASMFVIAVDVEPPEPMSSELRPSDVLSDGVSEMLSVSMPAVVPLPTWKLTELVDPSSSLMPLKSVERPMRLISSVRLWNSWSSVSLSWLDTEPLADCTASSRRRTRMLLTSLSAPSPVCTREMPSLALRLAWSSEATCARSRSLIARPAASSAAVEMRRPVDSRRKLPASLSVMEARLRCALIEAELVLTRRPMCFPGCGVPWCGGVHRSAATPCDCSTIAGAPLQSDRRIPRRSVQERDDRPLPGDVPGAAGARSGQQVQGGLRQRVGLREHRDARLLQDLVARQVRRLLGDID